jgi:hypothetical protein
MATHRYISTTFWDDAWIQELEPSEKFVYLYLMTNPLTSISGVYKITDRRISFDTGYDTQTIKTIMEKFTASKKAIRFGEWVVLPSWPKHQDWKSKPTIRQGIETSLMELKDDELLFIYNNGYQFPMDNIFVKRKIEIKKETHEPEPGYEGDTNGGTYGYDTHTVPIETGYDTPTIPIEPGYEGDTNRTIELNSNWNSIQSKLNIVVDLNNDSKNQSGKLVENSGNKPTTTFSKVQEEAKTLGYFLSERQAYAFLVMDQTWLSGKHSFLAFAAWKISDDPVYSGKTKSDKERIFAKGWKYENWLQEYPEWLTKQLEAEKKEILEKLKANPPRACPHCGADMQNKSCPKCKGFVWFNEEKQLWEYEKDFQPPQKAWEKKIAEDDIDF